MSILTFILFTPPQNVMNHRADGDGVARPNAFEFTGEFSNPTVYI